MIDTSTGKSLFGKAWSSLTHRGPVGLTRDVRDYLRWRLGPRGGAPEVSPSMPKSNWDLNQEELNSLPDVLRSKPVLVYAEATTRCNLHCFMCRLSFPETTRQTREHMRLETFARLEPLLEPGSRLSLFGLGEPLLNPNFVEMLRIAKERGSFVGLNSNAMLLTERIARAMVELEQDLLVVSFSGGTRETYERVITGANYERVLGNLRRLNELKAGHSAISYQLSAISRQEPAVIAHDSSLVTHHSAPGLERAKPVLQLQFTAMRDNVREVPEMVRLALELRCAGAVVMPLTVVDPSLAEQSLLNPDLWPQVEKAFAEARAVADTATYPFDLQLPTAELLRALRRQSDGETRGHGDAETRGDTETRGRGDGGTRRDGETGKFPLPLGEGQGEGPSTRYPERRSQNSDPALSTQHSAPGGRDARAPGTQDSELRTQNPEPICYEPWQTFYARDDGTVNTCCYSNRILGDLKEQTALEIWNGELYRKFRARMRSAHKPSECQVCHKLRGDDWYDQRIDEAGFYDEL